MSLDLPGRVSLRPGGRGFLNGLPRWLLLFLVALAGGCGRSTQHAEVRAGVRVRWVERKELFPTWFLLPRITTTYALVSGPIDVRSARHEVPCRGAWTRLDGHPTQPAAAYRCNDGAPWQSVWYLGLAEGPLPLEDCLSLGAGPTPIWGTLLAMAPERDASFAHRRIG